MVTVAKSFDAPVKLLFPRELGAARPSMLGLGDIVIPGDPSIIHLWLKYHGIWIRSWFSFIQWTSLTGIFIALLLRFDYMLGNQKHNRKHYFITNLIGYVLGLITTVWVMYQFNAAQVIVGCRLWIEDWGLWIVDCGFRFSEISKLDFFLFNFSLLSCIWFQLVWEPPVWPH